MSVITDLPIDVPHFHIRDNLELKLAPTRLYTYHDFVRANAGADLFNCGTNIEYR
jgi:hypothetical protein